jgi:hypothetical protein
MLSIITGSVRSANANVWAFMACIGFVVSGCDKVPLLAPQQSTITVSSNSSVVQANGSAQIRATVLEQSGTPVQNGTTVTFTTNLGALSPAEARTLNGVATVQFVGNGQSGRAQIRALSGGAVSDPLELSVGAAATGRVNVSANPTSVAANGGTSTITATVVDASGNPLGGVPVTFSTTAGTLSPSVVNTDFTGTATTSLSTSREASVTATAGGTTSTAVVVGVAVRPTISISVAAGSGTPTEGGITTFSITASPAANGAPIQTVTVDYGDGTSDNLGSISGTVSVQHVYRDSGSFTPTVTVQDASGTSTSASTVIFVQPLLASISSTRSTTGVFTFTANVPEGVTVASTRWDYGDGTSETKASNVTTHDYAAPGSYTVRATVRTSTGASASASTVVTEP